MPSRPVFSAQPANTSGFEAFSARMAFAALHEIAPAAPGAETAALGFSLGLARRWLTGAGLIWVGEDMAFSEEGAPYPQGLAQYGFDLAQVLVVRAKKREEAMWAAEQGLTLAGAVVICMLSAGGRALDLKATRRLLLFAEHNGARCLLLRPESGASAAWTRWRISPAESAAEDNELGAPAFRAELIRQRSGPSGQVFTLDWNAHEHAFAERGGVACDLSAAPKYGPADQIRAHA